MNTEKIPVFNEFYFPLIKAFCELEAAQFRFREIEEERRKAWAEKLFQSIISYKREDPAFNYAIFESISNMGLVLHSMKISTSHLEASRNLRVRFPMNPRQDCCTFRIEEVNYS